MKLHIRLGVLCCFFVSTLCANAQVNHFINLWGEAGASSFITDIAGTSSGVGPGGAAGFGYELRAGKFALTAGVGFAYNNASLLSIDAKESYPDQIDSEGDVFTLNFNQRDRIDTYSYGYVQIPLLAGVHLKRFYMLAGAKFNLYAFASNKVKANLSTSGTYPQFIDDFENMPEHNFVADQPFEQTNKVKFTQDVVISAEIGWRLGEFFTETGYDVPKSKVQYRIAAFCDYGLFDIHTRGDKDKTLEVLDINAGVNGMHLNDVLSTTIAHTAVNNLFVGVKFTVLFQLPKPGICVICDD